MTDNSIRTIVLMRHGQSNFNAAGMIQDPLIPKLTKLGIKQVQKNKMELDKLNLEFDMIVCSDTTRNIESLKEIYPNYYQMNNVSIDSRLQERYHKDIVGKTKVEIEHELGKSLDPRMSVHLYFEGTAKSNLTYGGYTNNESLQSVEKRLKSLIKDLQKFNTILLLGNSITNHYILEIIQFGTIGVERPKYHDGREIDFQRNDELRVVSVDEEMSFLNMREIYN